MLFRSRMIDNAFKAAWHALEQEHQSYSQIPVLERFKKGQLQQGNPQGASKTSEQINKDIWRTQLIKQTELH